MKIAAWPAYKSREKNPYNYLLYKMLSKYVEVDEFGADTIFKQYDIFHFHWPKSALNESNKVLGVLKILYTCLLIVVLKMRGTKIVWTVHNLKTHEEKFPIIESIFTKFFNRTIDAIICFNKSVYELTIRTYPKLRKKKFVIIPHGHYKEEYSVNEEPNQTKNSGYFEFLFFGAIRDYKNVVALVESFRNMKNQNESFLTVVGKPRTDELKSEVIDSAGNSQSIKLVLQFVSKEEVPKFFMNADVVVLPFSEILNSGSAILALSFSKPILVPNKGSFPELKEIVGDDWVYLYEGEISGAVLDKYYCDHIKLKEHCESRNSPKPNLDALEWSSIALKTFKFFKTLIN